MQCWFVEFFFFFLISDIKILSKKKNNTAQYIGNVLNGQKHQDTKLQRSRKTRRERQEKDGKTKHHSRRVKKTKDLNSRMDHSHPSKLLAFRSHHIHHIKQCGTIFHISILWCRLKLHDQESSKSTTLCKITQQYQTSKRPYSTSHML